MLITFPVGLWIFSLVCDIIYAVTGGLVWSVVAFYAIGGGIIGALLAAIPGLIDLLTMPSSAKKARTVGIWHMSLNLAAVVLFAINFYLRATTVPGAVAPFVLSIVGVGVILVSGWLGGELVHVLGVTMEREREAEKVTEERRDLKKAA